MAGGGGAWAGFSERELRRLQRGADLLPAQPRRPPSINKSRQELQRKQAVQQLCEKTGRQDGGASVLPEQQLSVPKPKPPSPQRSPPPSQSLSAGEQQGAGNQPVEPGCNGDAEPNLEPVKKKMELQEKTRWEVLQQEQKLMEEKNKRKKAVLAKAIAERSRRTQAEAVKLKRIEKQLQALDDMVSADIGILRNRIDQASLEFSYARKRYDKAESEYVNAKLDLQRKTEIKEQLTEHLCTIIQQNELRKAKKLEQLMQQLEVEADEENLELEIEVEQILQQQQEGDAARQAAESEKLAPVSTQNAALRGLDTGCANKGQTVVVSEQFAEQPLHSRCSEESRTGDSTSGEPMVSTGT